MKKYLIELITKLSELFFAAESKTKSLIIISKKGYGNSYGIKDIHLFKRRD